MKAFITVVGKDTVGVVARVSGLCSELSINIEDISQSILQGMFAMIMLVDLSHCSVSHEELRGRIDALGRGAGDAGDRAGVHRRPGPGDGDADHPDPAGSL